MVSFCRKCPRLLLRLRQDKFTFDSRECGQFRLDAPTVAVASGEVIAFCESLSGKRCTFYLIVLSSLCRATASVKTKSFGLSSDRHTLGSARTRNR